MSAGKGSAHPHQELQLFKTAAGKVQVRGLLPCQQLLHMPDGRLLLINSPSSSSATISLPMMTATTPTVLQSEEAAPFSAGDKIRMDPNFALEKIQSMKVNGPEEVIKKVTYNN